MSYLRKIERKVKFDKRNRNIYRILNDNTLYHHLIYKRIRLKYDDQLKNLIKRFI